MADAQAIANAVAAMQAAAQQGAPDPAAAPKLPDDPNQDTMEQRHQRAMLDIANNPQKSMKPMNSADQVAMQQPLAPAMQIPDAAAQAGKSAFGGR